MGSQLFEALKNIHAHLGEGSIKKINYTRLYILIGKELLKNIKKIPDSPEIMDALEKAFKTYFMPYDEKYLEEFNDFEKSLANPEFGNDTSNQNITLSSKADDKFSAIKKEAESTEFKLKLNISKIPENNQTRLFKKDVCFLPSFFETHLLETLFVNLTPTKEQELMEQIETNAMNESFDLITSVAENMKLKTNDIIRVGLLLHKVLGIGYPSVSVQNKIWKITIHSERFLQSTKAVYHSIGFIKGFLKYIDPKLTEVINLDNENTDPNKLVISFHLEAQNE